MPAAVSHGALSLLLLTTCATALDPLLPDTAPPPARPGQKLVWNDEFAGSGRPDPAFWSSESGFVRNQELQWYQSANAVRTNGVLRIEGRKERVANPNYVAGSTDWKTSRQYADYTSTSLTGKKTWQYGHVEVRARIDGQMGTWPAIWCLGSKGEWPTNGEVDIMEFYPSGTTPLLHANVAWGTATRWQAAWNAKTKPLSDFTSKDPDWLKKFHLWSMDWNHDTILLQLDGTTMNTVPLSKTVNNDGTDPFQDRTEYGLLNLAIGANGGDPSKAVFPMVFEVDYIRVWQPAPSATGPRSATRLPVRVLATGAGWEFALPDPGSRIEIRWADGRLVGSWTADSRLFRVPRPTAWSGPFLARVTGNGIDASLVLPR